MGIFFYSYRIKYRVDKLFIVALVIKSRAIIGQDTFDDFTAEDTGQVNDECNQRYQYHCYSICLVSASEKTIKLGQ